jgi:GAF domain-containing protein
MIIENYCMRMGDKMVSKSVSSGDSPIKQEILLTKNRVLKMMDSASSLKEISDVIWDEARRLTGSEHCYVAFVDPENRDSVGISFSHLTGGCQAYADMGEARFKVRDDGSYGGLLGYSLDTGESFYTHSSVNHPVAHGLPPGHEPVSQFLSAAVKYEDAVLGQIVLANPEEDYSDDHLEIADQIADIYGIVLNKMIFNPK